MDEDGNRAAVTLDQAGYTIGHATKIEKLSAIQADIFRWHAKQCGIEDYVFTRLVSEGGDREFKRNSRVLRSGGSGWKDLYRYHQSVAETDGGNSNEHSMVQ